MVAHGMCVRLQAWTLTCGLAVCSSLLKSLTDSFLYIMSLIPTMSAQASPKAGLIPIPLSSRTSAVTCTFKQMTFIDVLFEYL